jgi:type IV pilus biogenesis protein CpaD/CtpE
MATTKTAIGQLKTKVTKHCTICGCSTKRNLTAQVYENNPTEIERAKQEIKEKADKKYTCRICKSIERDLSK